MSSSQVFLYVFLSWTYIISVCTSTKESDSSEDSEAPSDNPHWDYKDTNIWPTDYTLCSEVDESPINIDTDDLISDSCTGEFNWTVDYNHTLFRATNNGHSLAVV